MKLKRYPLLFLLSLSLGAFVSSCDEESALNDVSFDREAMLTSLADGLIIPNFRTLQSSVGVMNSLVNEFSASPSVEKLKSVRAAWQQAVEDYQHTSAFGFGPANLPLGSLSSVLGVFPVDEGQLERNIGNPDFNLPASFDRDVRGFYAIEYLLFGEDLSVGDLVNGFDEDRLAYLLLLVSEVKAIVDAVVFEWEGSYRDHFIASEGTSAGSSISVFYNEFIRDYENLKNFKVELPAGLTAGQAAADPRLVEAYYSGISNQLLIAHFENSKNIWKGLSRGGEELIGFEEHLEAVVGGPTLITHTKIALTDISRAISSLPSGSLSENVETQEVRTLRDALQANTANFKSSMSSLLGISITFNSGDGD